MDEIECRVVIPWECATPMQEPRCKTQGKDVGQDRSSILVQKPANCRENGKYYRTRQPMISFF